jgi:membrane-bound lytic murein transglycosylase F
MQSLQARGQLRVVTLNAPNCYYLGTDGPEGFEYRLAEAFAQSLGVQLVVKPVRDLQTMREMLADGSADLAAAQITATEEWRRAGLSTVSYEEIPQLVVQRRGKPPPRNIASLRGARLVVPAGSPQRQLLNDIRGNGAPYLAWTELPRDQADPLDWVTTGDSDYAIVDASEYAFTRHLYPDTLAAFTLPDPRAVQWVVRPDGIELRDSANRFLQTARESGLLTRIERENAPPADTLAYEDARRFQTDITQLLPELQPMFESAAMETGLDWRLLAAVGYQESKWLKNAESANGAKGIMMLTPAATKTVGIANRDDLNQNILGGARYLVQVLGMVPDRIEEPDRTWLALAAYNVGYGHLEDARVLVQMRGGNPDRWDEVRKQLPLLAQEQWYTQVKRGYARGWEPAEFVEQVKQYLAVLEWSQATSAAALAEKTP